MGSPAERSTDVDVLDSPELDRNGKYALLSVSDKNGIADLADALVAQGYNIISTGGTAEILTERGIDVVPVEAVTGNPELYGGRIKTISGEIEGGILYKRDVPEDVAQAKEAGHLDIGVVVCNFYPFEATLDREGVTEEEILAQIDNGGPAMVRAAATNHEHVTVIVDPADYGRVAEAMQSDQLTVEMRRELAGKAWHEVAYYDGVIARHYSHEGTTPERTALPLRRKEELRYGENPDQVPAWAYFIPGTESPMARLEHHSGRELTHTNYTDIDAGLQAVNIFDVAAAAVIKHNTPCGIALGESPASALLRAVEADPKSVFGSAIVMNQPADMEVADVINELKTRGIKIDIIGAPSMEQEVVDAIGRVRSSTGIYTFGPIPDQRKGHDRMHYRAIEGGVLVQPWNGEDYEAGFAKWEVPTDLKPNPDQVRQAQLGWKFASRVRSNAVVVVHPYLPMTLGIGTGQTSRIAAAEMALTQAGKSAYGAVMVSDSFFPFQDCVGVAGEAGIACVVQQGGSIRDQASIDAANRLGVSMIFTGERVFWH